jgi:hypothetical protein
VGGESDYEFSVMDRKQAFLALFELTCRNSAWDTRKVIHFNDLSIFCRDLFENVTFQRRQLNVRIS